MKRFLVRSPWLIGLAAALAAACSAGGGGNAGGGGGGGTSGGPNGSGGAFNPNPGSGGGIVVDPGTTPQGAREPLCASECGDLSSDGPIFDEGVPSNAPDLFQGTASGAGPCIIEPGDNSMVPYNWTRPRVRFTGEPGTTYQIRVHADREKDELVAYTNKDTWILPAEFWDNGDENQPKGLTYNVFDEDITITVRASTGGESSVKFRIAPVPAGGSMVFWASSSTLPGLETNALYGFSPGDEGIALTLSPGMVQGTIRDDTATALKRALEDGTPEGQVRCLGCHTSTPDGAAVNVTDHWPWNVKVASIKQENAGAEPDYITPMGSLLAQMPWQGVTSYSKADWDAGKRRYVTSFGKRPATVDTQPWKFWGVDCDGVRCAETGQDDLIWIDLTTPGDLPDTSTDGNAIQSALIAQEGTGWGFIQRTNDPNGAVLPDWSHDGKTIVYTSTDSTADGHVGKGSGQSPVPTVVDLYTVPFNDGEGGTAAPVPGASEAAHAEYYPDYSADDQLIAFTRVSDFEQVLGTITDQNQRQLYYRPESEIFVVSAAGGEAVRLPANDSNSCAGDVSGTLTNSWPKWSPLVRSAGNKKYYFLVFSSTRQSPGMIELAKKPMSQLYMTTIVDDGSGNLQTYGAVYLWNQRNLVTLDASGQAQVRDFVMNNVTPAWDEFQAPPVPPVRIE